MKKILKVVKTGGKLIDDEERLEKVLTAFAKIKGNKILVHGGGSMASRVSLNLGIKPQMTDGRRITTALDIEIVTMVYAGWINKKIVVKLQQLGCNAVGLSGADGNVIVSRKRPVGEIDYGFVGDIEKVNSGWIQTLLESGLTPVFSAITHGGDGTLLNTNSDTVAAEVAVAMSEKYDTRLMFCFEKKGVLTDVEKNTSVIPIMNWARYQRAKDEKTIHNGMLPKLQMGFDALRRNVSQVMIGDETILEKNPILFTQLKL